MDGETFNEYGLAFDYFPGESPEFDDDGEETKEGTPGFFRYQISTGGPGDEFRFYADGSGYDWNLWKVEYTFLDWFDGASRTLHGEDYRLLDEIFRFFVEIGSCEAEYNKAQD